MNEMLKKKNANNDFLKIFATQLQSQTVLFWLQKEYHILNERRELTTKSLRIMVVVFILKNSNNNKKLRLDTLLDEKQYLKVISYRLSLKQRLRVIKVHVQ